MTLQDREVVQKLSAIAAGGPIPRGEALSLPVTEGTNRLALAFVRMGGEARPWAVGWQLGGEDPQVHAVPDGRQTDRIGAMLQVLGPKLARFLGSPMFGGNIEELEQALDAPLGQVWLPNGSHLEMLHMLNLRYTFARGDEDVPRTEALKGLGRAAGYLYRESGRPGEVGVVNASRALLDAFVFPIDDLRAQHLGLLLAMIETDGDLATRELAGEEAEKMAVSTTLDPVLERDVLEPLVTAYNEARGSGQSELQARFEEEISEVLRSEVVRRLSLTSAAADLLAADVRGVNPGALDLADDSKRTRWWEYLSLEAALAAGGGWSPPSAETDRKATAGAVRYIRLAGAADEQVAALRLHDEDLIEQAIATGDVIRGVVTAVRRQVAPGMKRSSPHWDVAVPLTRPFRLKPGSELMTTLEDGPGGGWITDVGQDGDDRVITVCMNKRSTGVPADDGSFVGEEVTMLPSSGGFVAAKLKRARSGHGPGDWITRRDGPPPSAAAVKSSDLLAELEKLRLK